MVMVAFNYQRDENILTRSSTSFEQAGDLISS